MNKPEEDNMNKQQKKMSQRKSSNTYTSAEIYTEIQSKQQTGNDNIHDRYL